MAAESVGGELARPLLQHNGKSPMTAEAMDRHEDQTPIHVPSSWRKQIGAILDDSTVKELPDLVLHDLLCALPETVCVLNAPLHPSMVGSAAVALPEQGAAAALQAKLLGIAADATGSLLVPHCHPAVTLVQFAVACGQVLVQLAYEIKIVTNPNRCGPPWLRAPLMRRQAAVLDLLNKAMVQAGTRLYDECPDAAWTDLSLEENHAEVILRWVTGLNIIRDEPLRQPVWRRGALECIADDVVQHSEKCGVSCLRYLVDAACEKLKPAHLREVLALRFAVQFPHVPLNWVLHHPSEYELRPSRVLLHVLWEDIESDRVVRASRVVRMLTILPRGAASDPGSMLRHALSRPGVNDWLEWTPFRLRDAKLGTALLYLDPPVEDVEAGLDKAAVEGEDKELASGASGDQGQRARTAVISSNCALLMLDVHWEAVRKRETQHSFWTGPWGDGKGQRGRGCEIQ